MKYLVKFFVVTFFFIISTHTFAEQKIVVLDMKYVLNNSKAGKGAQDFLEKTFKENQKRFSDQEAKLKKEESDLLAKKSILTKEEYQKNTDELRKKVIDYQSARRSSLETITSQRATARKELLKVLDPILNSYMKENEISFIMEKKNMILASPDLDITNIIIEKLNKKLPSLNLK